MIDRDVLDWLKSQQKTTGRMKGVTGCDWKRTLGGLQGIGEGFVRALSEHLPLLGGNVDAFAFQYFAVVSPHFMRTHFLKHEGGGEESVERSES